MPLKTLDWIETIGTKRIMKRMAKKRRGLWRKLTTLWLTWNKRSLMKSWPTFQTLLTKSRCLGVVWDSKGGQIVGTRPPNGWVDGPHPSWNLKKKKFKSNNFPQFHWLSFSLKHEGGIKFTWTPGEKYRAHIGHIGITVGATASSSGLEWRRRRNLDFRIFQPF